MQKKREITARPVTRWSRQYKQTVDESEVLGEYPRPGMVRENWQCLNGLWDYAFIQKEERPVSFEGKILVPFSPETCLSGVNKQLMPGSYLWYERKIHFTRGIWECYLRGGRIFLHFGAVDQSCQVYVNGEKAGSHNGGYFPFSIDITDIIKKEETGGCTLSVRAQDVSDTSYHSVGKQTLKPGGMYYPATGGIWQTVWLEAVPAVFIKNITWEACYDESAVQLKVESPAGCRKGTYFVKLCFLNSEYEDMILPFGKTCRIPLPDFVSWSPENPWLYKVKLELYEGEENAAAVLLDSVESYFAMRKCCLGTDNDGIRRIFLNNRPYMQVGILDQGYWPESMYTPPSDEAMVYDIETMKNLGFNMLRKHVKVESERWYYHCDRLGMLVWQDMVNGGRKNKSFYVTYLATLFQLLGIKARDGHRILLSRQDKKGRQEYERELTKLVLMLKNHPSVVCMVPFNEGWGQFETERMTSLIRTLNKEILVDQASGWFDMGGGDFKSIHCYFFKLKLKKETTRALALTEYGGYARRIAGHCAQEKEYGYKTFRSKEALEEGYEKLMKETVLPAVKEGVSATVYTQLSDVEEEINGLLTYDREVLKMEPGLIRKWNSELRRVVENQNDNKDKGDKENE